MSEAVHHIFRSCAIEAGLAMVRRIVTFGPVDLVVIG
jgi:hypothetical protein